tara:strand:- start:1917 stop:2939 length:1023 start_codon:yes stop_codon:yes gene_type:complete
MSQFLINPYRFAAAGDPPFWEELGRTTLGSANSDIAVSAFADRTNLMIIDHYTGGSNSSIVTGSQFNTDTASSYNVRTSVNNAADATLVNQNSIENLGFGATTSAFGVSYIENISGQEKLLMSNYVSENGSTTASLPLLYENAGKYADSSASITTVTQTSDSAYTFDPDSEVVVLGYDSGKSTGDSVWELVSRTTATGLTNPFITATFTPKNYMFVRVFITGQTADPVIRFGTGGSIDSGTNYASRYSYNNGSSSTWANGTAFMGGISNVNPTMSEMFIVNHADYDKLCFGTSIDNGLAYQTQYHAKWKSAGNQIDIMEFQKNSGYTANAGSFIEIWGFD